MKNIQLFLLLLIASLGMLAACTVEDANRVTPPGGGDPITTAKGSLVVGVPGVVKARTLAQAAPGDYAAGAQNSREMSVVDIYAYFFRQDGTSGQPDDDFQLVYSVKTRNYEPTDEANIPLEKAVFPLFDYGDEQYGDIDPGDEVKILFVANYSVIGAGRPTEAAREAAWNATYEGMSIKNFRNLTLEQITRADYLNDPFVMYGESGVNLVTILAEETTTETDVALVRLAARIDITNHIDPRYRILSARIVSGASSSYLAPTADPAVNPISFIGAGGSDDDKRSPLIENLGYDALTGEVGAPRESCYDSMWSQLFTYATYNVAPGEGLLYDGSDPTKRTPTQVEVTYSFTSTGEAPEMFTRLVEFRHIDTVTVDGTQDTIVGIQRNHRYQILMIPANEGDIPDFTVIGRPWETDVQLDTTSVQDAALALTFPADMAADAGATSWIDGMKAPIKYFGGKLALPAAPADGIFEIGYQSVAQRLDITKPDWVNVTVTPESSTLAAGGYRGTIRVEITANPIMQRKGELVIRNSQRTYKYEITQDGDNTFKLEPSANSFIVTPGDKIVFPASRANIDVGLEFESGAGTPVVLRATPRLLASDTVTAQVMWADTTRADGTPLIADADVVVQGVGSTALIGVSVPAGVPNGNAVVTLTKQNGARVWSWHIWVTDYNPNLNLRDVPSRTHGSRDARARNDGGYYVGNGLVLRYTGAGRNTQTDDDINRLPNTTPGDGYGDERPNDAFGIYDATNVFMDRNLGARSNMPGDPGTKGLLYQWGRKDPFPNSADWTDTERTLLDGAGQARGVGKYVNTSWDADPNFLSDANNLEVSIAHPLTFIFGTDNAATGHDWFIRGAAVRDAQNDGLWGWSTASNMNYRKSVYDPCPTGWRVPKRGAWQGIDDDDAPTAGDPGYPSYVERTYATVWRGAAIYGRIGFGGLPDAVQLTWSGIPNWMATSWEDPFIDYGDSSEWSDATVGYYPAAGIRSYSNGNVVAVTLIGCTWASSRSHVAQMGSCLDIRSADLGTSSANQRAWGFSVRCVQD